VMRRATAEQLGLRYARLLGAMEMHNAYPDDPVQYRGGWALDRDALYAQAGVGPADIDFLQTYDDYPVIVMMQIEDLGFCAKGEAPAFVRSHTLTSGGDFPHNTSGGQLSVGQAGAAGGHLGLVEAIRQLTDEAGETTVPGAKLGLVSGFGMINYDRGLASAAAIVARSA
jgi:acetyl-CoA acetyltransferase